MHRNGQVIDPVILRQMNLLRKIKLGLLQAAMLDQKLSAENVACRRSGEFFLAGQGLIQLSVRQVNVLLGFFFHKSRSAGAYETEKAFLIAWLLDKEALNDGVVTRAFDGKTWIYTVK